MKKNNIYIIAILLLFVCTSCEDWLAVSPKSEIEASELFETKQGFDDALSGIYIGLESPYTYGEYLSWEVLEYLAHQYDNEGGTYEELQNYDFDNTTSVSVIAKIWKQQYNTIASINLLIESLENYGSVLSDANYNAIMGQALALRAYCHFDLLRLYGHGNLENRTDLNNTLTIPYVTEVSKNITAQKSYDETFKLVEKDIEEALVYLNPDATVKFFKMNYYAAVALQARVLLWEGKKAEALTAVKPLLTRGYLWGTVGSETNSFSPEHLWHINVTLLPDYMETSYQSSVNGAPNYDILKQTEAFYNDIFEIEDGFGPGLSDVRASMQHLRVDTDVWLTVKLAPTEDSKTSDYIIPMLKISEAYLIAIECYTSDIEGKDLTEAIKLINLLKANRNIMPQFYLESTASVEEIQDAVFKEYRKDFIQEGQLFYFYKRKGMLTFPRQTGAAGSEMTDEKYVLPYPDVEIEFGRVQKI